MYSGISLQAVITATAHIMGHGAPLGMEQFIMKITNATRINVTIE